jgi:hypothetical protein
MVHFSDRNIEMPGSYTMSERRSRRYVHYQAGTSEVLFWSEQVNTKDQFPRKITHTFPNGDIIISDRIDALKKWKWWFYSVYPTGLDEPTTPPVPPEGRALRHSLVDHASG